MFLAAPTAFLSAVLLFAASVDAGRSCSTARYGDLRGRSLQLPAIPLHEKSNYLHIADTCYTFGPYYRSVGVKVVACDRWKPIVLVSKVDRAWVKLVGSSHNAVAHVTQYCRPGYDGDSAEVDVPYAPLNPVATDQYDDTEINTKLGYNKYN